MGLWATCTEWGFRATNRNKGVSCELPVGPCHLRNASEGNTKGMKDSSGASFEAVVICTY